MMQSSTLLKLSRQGNVDAIATLMNQALNPKGISVRIRLVGNTLKVLLEGQKIPDREHLTPYVFRGILRLGLTSVEAVYLYARQLGQPEVAWVATLTLSDLPLSHPPFSPTFGAIHSLAKADTLAKSEPSLTSTMTPTDLSAMMGRDISIEHIQSVVAQHLTLENVIVDIELEGCDLLVTLETRTPFDAAQVSQQIKQCLHNPLNNVYLGTLRLVRLYQRHPISQRTMPLQEILLSALPADYFQDEENEFSSGTIADMMTVAGTSMGNRLADEPASSARLSPAPLRSSRLRPKRWMILTIVWVWQRWVKMSQHCHRWLRSLSTKFLT